MRNVMPTLQKKYLWCIYLLLWLCWASECFARPQLQVGIGYNDQLHKNQQGAPYNFEVLLSYQLLSSLGYDVSFIMAPYSKLTELLAEGAIDIAPRETGPTSGNFYYSSAYAEFHDLIFALDSFPAEIGKLDDLTPYSIVSFQNASYSLGPDFQRFVAKAKNYQEVLDHTQAVQMLLKGRVELVILDKTIFYQRLATFKHPATSIRSFNLLPAVQHRFVFTDAGLQQQVEQLLQQWRSSGKLTQLQQKANNSAPEVDKLLRRHQSVHLWPIP